MMGAIGGKDFNVKSPYNAIQIGRTAMTAKFMYTYFLDFLRNTVIKSSILSRVSEKKTNKNLLMKIQRVSFEKAVL